MITLKEATAKDLEFTRKKKTVSDLRPLWNSCK